MQTRFVFHHDTRVACCGLKTTAMRLTGAIQMFRPRSLPPVLLPPIHDIGASVRWQMVLRRLEGRARRPGVGTYQDGDMRGHVTGLVWRRGLVSAVDQNANSRARGSRMNPKRLNQMMMRDDQTPHTLLDLFAKHKDNFDYVNLNTCLNRLTKFTKGQKAARQLEGDERFRELLAQIERRACEFEPGLANTMHSLGSLTDKGFRWKKREASMLKAGNCGIRGGKTKDFKEQD